MHAVELWWAPVDDPSPWLPLLTGAEQDQVARYRQAPDRARVATARALTRLAVAQHLAGVDPRDVAIDRSCSHCRHPTHGKPRLASGSVQFNASHAGAVAAVAVSTTISVGFDVEPTGDERLRDYRYLASAALTADVLASQAESPSLDLLLLHWTAKEAAGKECGLGLLLDFRRVQIDFGGASGGERCVAAHVDSTWHIARPQIADGLLAAIATTAPATVEVRRIDSPAL